MFTKLSKLLHQLFEGASGGVMVNKLSKLLHQLFEGASDSVMFTSLVNYYISCLRAPQVV